MKILFFLMPLLFLSTGARGMDIQARGTWHVTVGRGELTSGPGSQMKSAYESSPAATALTISNATGKEWQVSVRKGGTSWPRGLTLYVRRTNHGTGKGEVSGGTAFIPITALDTRFFTGRGDPTTIHCQYKLEGMSLDISPGTYGFTVIYTVED